jgi:hypothetical protein
VLGVVLEARPLEVLDGVLTAILQHLAALHAERVAVDGYPAVRLPVVEEAPLHAEAGLAEAGLGRAGGRDAAEQPAQ